LDFFEEGMTALFKDENRVDCIVRPMQKSQQILKEEVARAAVAELSHGVRLGVGTGSTVDCFIDALAASGLRVEVAVASSVRSEERLRSRGIAVTHLSELASPLDVYVDGADEIDPRQYMIKGGGAALTREKIVASASRRFICIVDVSKQVPVLGAFPLPVEVIEMAVVPVSWAFAALGGQPVRRAGVTTDNGHPILDIHGLRFDDPPAWEDRLNAIPGIVTHGIFAHQKADLALIAGPDGVIRVA
jgi:ribose 5-phosphate isomerase A